MHQLTWIWYYICFSSTQTCKKRGNTCWIHSLKRNSWVQWPCESSQRLVVTVSLSDLKPLCTCWKRNQTLYWVCNVTCIYVVVATLIGHWSEGSIFLLLYIFAEAGRDFDCEYINSSTFMEIMFTSHCISYYLFTLFNRSFTILQNYLTTHGGSRHLEVFDGHSRVSKEALTNADLDPCLLHPLLQVVQSLSNIERQTDDSEQAEDDRRRETAVETGAGVKVDRRKKVERWVSGL